MNMQALENEMLLVGMVRSAGAEDLEARKILTSFGISPDGVLKAAEAIVAEKGLGQVGNGGGGGVENVNLPPLPFSEATKKTLSEAVSIAQRMSPDSNGAVLPGHVLLALLEFDDRYNVATEDTTKCAGLALFKRATQNSPAVVFDGTKFCRMIAADMKTKAVSNTNANGGSVTEIREREVVVVGANASGNTPTLDKVGIDLTEMAREGRLDAVYGRENEIRMCLRTLGRRRKSNPVLIGEAGGEFLVHFKQ